MELGKPEPARRIIFFDLPYRLVLSFSCLCPFVGMFLCLAISNQLHYHSIRNSTFCPEIEFQMVSISKTIGIHSPQRFIWVILIALHFPGRLFVGSVYTEFYLSSTALAAKSKCFKFSAFCMKWEQLVETCALLALSIVDIESSFLFHAGCFVLWLVCQSCYQFNNVFLHYWSGFYWVSRKSKLSFWIKLSIFLSVASFALSTSVTYPVHMNDCVEWVYFFFCLVEYVIVVLNIGFHFVGFFDFPNLRVGLYGDYSRIRPNVTGPMESVTINKLEYEKVFSDF